MANFCENCGASLFDGAKFCVSCGQVIPLILPAEQPGQIIQQSVTPESPVLAASTKKKPFYKRWWFGLIIVLVVGSVVIIGANMPDHLTEKLILGDWVLVNDDNCTLSFYENGAFVESNGYQQYARIYAIVYKSLGVCEDGADSRYQWYQWNRNKTKEDGCWFVSRDQLILGNDIYVKKHTTGDIPTSNTPLTVESRNNKQQVPQEILERIFSSYPNLIIISHDVEGLIDRVSYQWTKYYNYMTLETKGVIAFEFKPDENEWWRYPAGDYIIEEKNWEKITGQYEYSYFLEGVWGRPDLDIFFELTINSFDGEFVEGSYCYRTREYGEYIDKAEDMFYVEPVPPVADSMTKRYYVDLYDDAEHLGVTKPRFIIDRDEGVLIVTDRPHIIPQPVTRIGG